ncbi:MAG TPA: ABC transporter permease [Flavobacteriales bacterium]|nr:ABC transporter permease [Flavobacteriales bacterium]
MLIKIAWRNIWRNKIRSLVVIIALALGLWAGTFTSGFYKGMMDQRINDVIESEMSHFQVHDTNFREELLAKYYMEGAPDIIEKIESDENVLATSGRVISTAMMGSANKNGGAKLIGIDPDHEKAVTNLDTKIVDGAYFEGVKRNPILISQKMAESFKLKLRSKVILTVQDLSGETVASSFRVVGIYKSGNGMLDEVNAYVNRDDLQSIMNLDQDQYHEIAVLINSHDLAEPTAKKVQEMYPTLEVKAWLDLATGMRYMVEAGDTFAYFIVGIILVALLFSVINTMLMAVMERTREIGMLMAVGLNRRKVFLMIMMETLFLSMIGGPLGLLIAYLFIQSTGSSGIDLGAIGETYNELGFSAVVRPQLDLQSYINISVMIFIMAMIAALFPALKALRLNPSEAIRKI